MSRAAFFPNRSSATLSEGEETREPCTSRAERPSDPALWKSRRVSLQVSGLGSRSGQHPKVAAALLKPADVLKRQLHRPERLLSRLCPSVYKRSGIPYQVEAAGATIS